MLSLFSLVSFFYFIPALRYQPILLKWNSHKRVQSQQDQWYFVDIYYNWLEGWEGLSYLWVNLICSDYLQLLYIRFSSSTQMGPDLHQMGQLWDFLNIICQYILSAKKKFQIFQSMIHANMLNFKFMNYKRETIVVTNVSVCLCLSSTQMKLKQCSFFNYFFPI